MENYIVINGKKAKLTKEQLKQLGIKDEKSNPYERRQEGVYYYFTDTGKIIKMDECNQYGIEFHKKKYESGNYCASIKMSNQDMLHDLLSRKLRQFSNLNGGIDLNSNLEYRELKEPAYCIYYVRSDNEFEIIAHKNTKIQGVVYFISPEIAQRAIEEIVKPFMKGHLEFVW